MSSSQTFYADAALFDMDGTLTDSIAAVEAAWDKVAREIGQDPQHVIAATHGKRAVDNLSAFKPHIKAHEMEDEVARFEETILYFADAYKLHSESSMSNGSDSIIPLSDQSAEQAMVAASNETTPELTPADSRGSSRAPSIVSSRVRSPSFSNRLLRMLSVASRLRGNDDKEDIASEVFIGDQEEDIGPDGIVVETVRTDALEAWRLEAAKVDRSVRILPGVKKLMDSIPAGRYAVATSGAKTYAYGCMNRVGITPPPVTITADDKRLKAGKPAPDPFLLAAECLGYDATKCVVFEDSPSGIRAGVASGATVIAVCTSHESAQIEDCGAHFIVDTLESVRCEVDGDRLKFIVLS